MLRGIVVVLGKVLRPLFRRKPDYSNIRKICVYKSGAIGDVLMSTPFLAALRLRFPNAQIDYWVGNWAKDGLFGNPNVNNVITYDPKPFYKHKMGPITDLAKRIRKEKYDIMFVLDKSYLVSLFGRILCRPRILVGFDRHGEGFANTVSIPYLTTIRKHEIKYYLDLALALDANYDKTDMQLFLSADHEHFAEEFVRKLQLSDSKLVGVGPTGGNPGQDFAYRKWPLERFIQVVKRLEEKGYAVLLFGGPGDYEELERIVAETSAKIVKSPTILEAAAVLKKCKLLICNDAGIMHVGAAGGVPVLSLFGSTDPIRKAPLGKKNKYLWKPMAVQDAEVFAVYSEAHTVNITKIQAQEVLDAVDEMLG